MKLTKINREEEFIRKREDVEIDLEDESWNDTIPPKERLKILDRLF